ncbi:tRNA pseudouridine synthase 3 [Entophlyctis sp. JEL0112]|nr:tRNA pseudouridine synthase 3 [Entophlyctis sp. JEL0112]
MDVNSDEFSNWSREELIAHIKHLQTYQPQQQQKGQPPRLVPATADDDRDERKPSGPTKQKKSKQPRPFDFSAHACRPIALKVAYLGWDYHGLAAQDETQTVAHGVRTIEGELFRALHTARLIPDAGGKGCGWSRCGRTDKGVSSFGQVVGVIVRSNLPIGASGTCSWPTTKRKRIPADDDGDFDDESRMDEDSAAVHTAADDVPIPSDFEEIPYVSRLNHILPPEIRILAWCPTTPNFNARFDCEFRRYRYFMPCEGMDVSRMQEAAKSFIGANDFRYFCKVDPSKNVKSYVRTVLDASVQRLRLNELHTPTTANREIQPISPNETRHTVSPDEFVVFEVKGHAFLWHQVRCMTAILQLVGRGLEPVSLVSDLLDMTKHPQNSGRPVYNMASETPLVLVECGFADGLLNWQIDPTPVNLSASETLTLLVSKLWEQWRMHAIKAVQLESLLQSIAVEVSAASSAPKRGDLRDLFLECAKEAVLSVVCGESGGFGGKSAKTYIPVMKRKRCDSVEERTVKYNSSKAGKK